MSTQNKPTTFLSLTEAISKVENQAEIPYIWSGIRLGSFGYVFGPAKSGKTILCENLGISLATNNNRFLGLPLHKMDYRVLFISMEEYIRERTKRNILQINKLGIRELNNYIVINENFPRFFGEKGDFRQLRSIIKETHANFVIIDSLTRMAYKEIEESSFCRELGYELREITNQLGITMIVIHHTPKLNGRAIDIDGVAGSRVLAQEADFLIGINRTAGNIHYIKDVAFRYASSKDGVMQFNIDDDLWINPLGVTSEQKILRLEDGRVDDTKRDQILDFIKSKESEFVETEELMHEFVESKKMSKPTLHSNLNTLADWGVISKAKKGKYYIPK